MTSKDVELRIRARDYSQKPLKAVTSAIESMAKAQEEQRQAAERGEVSARDLEATYRKLESAGQQLLKLNSLIEVFKRQSASLANAAAKTEKLRAEQAKLRSEYEAATTVTARQEAAMARVNRQVEAATKAQANQAARVARTTADLERYGIASANVGNVQTGLINAVSQVNSVLEKQDNIISTAPAAAAQAKIAQALRQQADQAIAAAKGYETLGRVVQSTSGALGPLGKQIQTIVSPAEAARRTLVGLETQVQGVGKELARSGKEVVDVAGKIRLLNQANSAVSGLAAQIDGFRNQVAALRSARTEYRAARNELEALASQMRTATGDTTSLGVKMQAAQQRVAAAAKVMRDTDTSARTMQTALRTAGVDTRNLAEAESRLIAVSRQSAAALDTLSGATNRSGKSARDGKKAWSLFNDEGRTTLSFMQRLRGEVLALTTTYVGLQGGITLAGGAVDAFKVRQQALIKMATVVGDSQQALNSEWEYMTGLANRLGIDLDVLSASYTKFAVSAKTVGLTLQESKYIFESISKSARVFHLSREDTQGVFVALEQMLSKGQVYAEELRQQLGERLPGAVALFAQAMGKSNAEFLKMMENGEVTSQAVINFARANSARIDKELGAATKGIDAMEARARNAMFNLKLSIADSGFIEAYARMLERITEIMSSPKGQDFAKKMGAAFSEMADAVSWCVDNIDLLLNVLGTLAGLKVAQVIYGIGLSLMKLGPIFAAMNKAGGAIITVLEGVAARMVLAGGAAAGLGVALKLLTRAIPFVGWALLAYDIGAIFYQQSETFRNACDLVIRDFKNLGNQLLAIGMSIPAVLYDLSIGIMRPITTQFASATQAILGWIADVLGAIPGVGAGLKQMVQQAAADLTASQRDFFASTGQVWDDVDKKWRKLNEDMVSLNADAMDRVKKNVASLSATVSAITNQQFNFTADPGTGWTQRASDIAAMTKELEKYEKAAAKADVDARKAKQRKNLPGRLALIDEEFAPQYARAKAIGGKEGGDIIKRLDAVVAQRKKAEETLFNAQQRSSSSVDRQARSLDALIQKYKELEAALGNKEVKIDPNVSFDSRLAAKIQSVNVQYDELIAKSKKLGEPGKQLAGQFDALRKRNIEYATTQAKLEEIKRIEDQLNTQQQTKKNLLDEINAKRQAGVISEDTAIRQTIDLYSSMNAGIKSSADELAAFAEKFRSSMSPEEFSRIMSMIAQVNAGLVDLTGTYSTMDTMVVQGVLGAMSTALQSVCDEMVNVVTGAESIGQAFSKLGVTVAKFFADFLQKIAMAILQQMALNAIASWGGGIGSAAVQLGGVAARHNGGIVGGKTGNGNQVKNGISPLMFAGAPRFHSGGFPGLKSDEVPTILQKGEQVLAADDPNNALNRVGKGGNGQKGPDSMRFVLVDDRSKVPEAMNTPEGEHAIMQILQRNTPTLKALVGNKKG